MLDHRPELSTPRLVERHCNENGNVVEVFEVAPGELVTVESGQIYIPRPTFGWPDDEVTLPNIPTTLRIG